MEQQVGGAIGAETKGRYPRFFTSALEKLLRDSETLHKMKEHIRNYKKNEQENLI